MATPTKKKRPSLTAKQQLFVEYYLRCLNATEAARLAGYAHPNQQGPRLLAQGEIKSAIEGCLLERSAEIRNEDIQKIRSHVYGSSCGIVYIIRADNGLYKIGKTVNFDRRIASLNGSIPYDLEVIFLIYSENITKLERLLHSRYSEKRVRYEWFRLDQSDIDSIGREYNGEII